MSRLVVVSNRTDVGAIAPGGLAITLAATLGARGGLWFGWSGQVTEPPHGQPMVITGGAFDRATLDLSPGEYAGFYLGYSNGTLWPICHGASPPADGGAPVFEAYLRTNARFADALLPLLRPDDLVWVHDFHLLPLGESLRRRNSRHRLGFFLHVPFPPLDALRAIAGGEQLVRAMAAYDLLGFQTRADLDAFQRAAAWAGAACRAAEVFPVGVDVPAIARSARAARDTPAAVEARSLRARHTLLVGVDRLVESKGLPERLRAFEAFLSRSRAPRPVLLQVGVPPPRATVRATRLAAALEDAAAAVNARHGREGVPHVRLHLSPVEHGPLMGVLRAAHVALVTPLRDGMNLVAKEFVAAQDPTDPGVLVLSRTAGAAYELDAALQVDPHDTDAVARAIGRACSASLAERLERHGALVESVRRGGPAAWSGAFLARLGARHAPARAPALAPG